MRIRTLLPILTLLLATACSQTPAPVDEPAVDGTPEARATAEPPRVGGDRDDHGCIPSAGYTWCARTRQCERPWELADREGFENAATAFKAYCTVPAQTRP